ncbi:hypothetical protein [Coleofasciculus sp. E1-EBD-02]|uniref:hypothetical protein n=1 Tax=Coleofasciculus sp. E1-EBD-02 TaxID=3068481 RepID=UPI0032F7F1FB
MNPGHDIQRDRLPNLPRIHVINEMSTIHAIKTRSGRILPITFDKGRQDDV